MGGPDPGRVSVRDRPADRRAAAVDAVRQAVREVLAPEVLAPVLAQLTAPDSNSDGPASNHTFTAVGEAAADRGVEGPVNGVDTLALVDNLALDVSGADQCSATPSRTRRALRFRVN
ncbi:hypothetical protein [Streptomyces lancefieldiae]|uniref:Uncharacterized protein n=1 Tax=Streptomyces lancefieldiae TaxID=3075520 RepID=A0ABU3AJ29_9ACTN|nr:hypothetical protein [Streptomyces sp. DSM 40712]MDT0609058.1 hypothetical protein [Streptomyces sp. DSM 40712]